MQPCVQLTCVHQLEMKLIGWHGTPHVLNTCVFIALHNIWKQLNGYTYGCPACMSIWSLCACMHRIVSACVAVGHACNVDSNLLHDQAQSLHDQREG